MSSPYFFQPGDRVQKDAKIYTWTIVAIFEDRAWIQCAHMDEVVHLSSLTPVPDTVTIEIPRAVADYCAKYSDGPWVRNELKIACQEALKK